MISYAQNGEDVVLARLFKNQPTGFWIDAGAGHPTDDSVTRHFSDLGWTGVNIEPNPSLFEALTHDRPQDVNVHAAAGEQAGTIRLWIGEEVDRFNGTIVESIRHDDWEGIDVPVVTVQDTVDEHAITQVDFLKVDVEGAEGAVLRGIDWKSLRPRVLVIECIHPKTHALNFDEWEDLVTGAGYVLALFDGINRFYVIADDAEARQALAAPANILDDYLPARWARIETSFKSAETYARSLEASRAEAQTHAQSLERRLATLNGQLAALVAKTERK